MTLTTVVVIYTALVATGGLCWQLYSWRRARETRVRVEVRLDEFPWSPVEVEEGVTIRVVNDGEQGVSVVRAGVYLQDGSRREVMPFGKPQGATIPGPIASKDIGTTYLLRWKLEHDGVDLRLPLVGWVRLATDDVLESTPTTLDRV